MPKAGIVSAAPAGTLVDAVLLRPLEEVGGRAALDQHASGLVAVARRVQPRREARVEVAAADDDRRYPASPSRRRAPRPATGAAASSGFWCGSLASSEPAELSITITRSVPLCSAGVERVVRARAGRRWRARDAGRVDARRRRRRAEGRGKPVERRAERARPRRRIGRRHSRDRPAAPAARPSSAA